MCFVLRMTMAGMWEVLIDEQLVEHELIQSHPLVNTATVVVSLKNIEKFLKSLDVNYRFMEVPQKLYKF